MIKETRSQKIKCNVADCAHNCIQDCTCRLEAIEVCPCSSKITKDPFKDTACSSYKFAEVQHNERYDI